MASTIKIKRSEVSGNPATLGAGELAYSGLADNGSNGGDRLYVGMGTETAGNAVNHIVIGGKYFTDKLDHTPGVLTASSALLVDSNKKLDELLVDNLSLNGNTISSTDTNGNLLLTPNGNGKVVVSNLYIGDDSTSYAESVQDIIGDMIQSNSESGIAVTYDDSIGKIDFNVNDPVITIAGDVDGFATMTDLGDTTITVTLDTVNADVGTFGSTTSIPVVTVNAKGLVTAVTTASITTELQISADSGTDTIALATDTLSFIGGEGIDTSIDSATNTLTISAEDATTSNKGIASFDTNNFTVTDGAVSTKTITLGTSTLTNGSTTLSIAGLQQLDVDNISVDGNEISSTNTNGDISLNPNGTGSVTVNSSRITGLLDPVDPQDAATKIYVDEIAQGLSVKPAVKAATTGNIVATYDNGTSGIGSTLTIAATATLDIDGVTSWSQYDGILVKDQTNAFENGRYYVSTIGNISTPWVLTRCGKCDEASEIPSMYVFVQEGTTYASTGWAATVENFSSFAVGVDDIVFTQFSGAGTYLAGNALSISGSTFNVNVAADGGIEISSDALQLKSSVAGDGLTISTGVLAVGGTVDRISVGSDSIDIASTYVGQSSITTLGVITSGTWNGTTLDTIYGGTGLTSYTTGDLLYASSANTLAKLSAGLEGKILQMGSSGVPVWGDIDGGTY
jgi:hypothetical protein